MKILRVVYTNEGRILGISKPTAIAGLLTENEMIEQEWYYNQPKELESFLKQNPDKENDVLKALSYWIIKKVFHFEEDQNHYGTIKRELKNFSHHLFKSLRAIAGRIADQIIKYLNPKKIKKIY